MGVILLQAASDDMEEIELIFARQLENLGVDYVDYYLLTSAGDIVFTTVITSLCFTVPTHGAT